MKKYYLLSCFMHAVLVAALLVVVGHKSSETVTVALSNDSFMAGGSGGDGNIPGSEPMHNEEKRIAWDSKKVKASRKMSLATSRKPPKNASSRENEKNDVIASSESSDITMPGTITPVGSDFDIDQTTVGFGGGGTGTGGYGPGSGFGGKGKNGTGGSGDGYGIGSNNELMKAQYLAKHFKYIRDLIMKNLIYPLHARKMGWKGQVTVSFIICEQGNVEQIRIIKSSGYKILDDNVAHTIRDVQPFPKPPIRAEIVIPVSYKLG
ncbi:MAG: energy transducer TonB [Syntrophorhabdaceae bacterium]|nr:energy transducer TonB [Syntrophorhabdaceae bacterium]HOC44999.1 energy transducer TonB [Syntrophorhabdaceae bacterium]